MELLKQVQEIPGPSGDEGRIAAFVAERCREIPSVTLQVVQDLVLAVRGKPKVALFAHMDTIGFTQAYERRLYRIGGPRVEGGELLRRVGSDETAVLQVRQKDDRSEWRLPKKVGEPGARWIYGAPLKFKKDRVTGPYLDNRAGVWNALRVLARCDDIAVAFVPGEEHSGRGAMLGARIVYEKLKITRALISDITWHTDSIKNGKGPAVSLRDRLCSRQAFVEEVLAAAEASGLPFQREVENDGGSDGHSIERSGYPIDWVFVGAPQKRCHTPREECVISDLHAMVELYACLVPALSR
jgi:putative aminopeptidase FrvX